jgi:hypothetical protein
MVLSINGHVVVTERQVTLHDFIKEIQTSTTPPQAAGTQARC